MTNYINILILVALLAMAVSLAYVKDIIPLQFYQETILKLIDRKNVYQESILKINDIKNTSEYTKTIFGHSYKLNKNIQKSWGVDIKNLPILNPMGINITLNNIGKKNRSSANSVIVFYNRVPKTGSSTIKKLLTLQSKNQKFNFEKSSEYDKRSNSISDEEKFVNYLDKIVYPTIFEKHMYFIDVSKYHSKMKVNWINIVRNPIDRFVSRFYYIRTSKYLDYMVERRGSQYPNEEWINKDLSSCILKSDPECDLSSKYMVDMQLTYFCGSSIEVYFLDLNIKNPITQVGF